MSLRLLPSICTGQNVRDVICDTGSLGIVIGENAILCKFNVFENERWKSVISHSISLCIISILNSVDVVSIVL